MPNISNYLFNFTLQGNNTQLLGSMGVLLVAKNKNKTLQVRDLRCHGEVILCFEPNPPRLYTPAVDIRTIVSAEFAGEMDELIVTEVLENPSCSENNNQSLSVKYFGRSARLIFNSSATSECVLLCNSNSFYSRLFIQGEWGFHLSAVKHSIQVSKIHPCGCFYRFKIQWYLYRPWLLYIESSSTVVPATSSMTTFPTHNHSTDYTDAKSSD